MSGFGPDDVPAFPRGVRLNEDVARGRTVLLAPERLFELEGTSLAVLSLVDGTASVQDMARALAHRYGAPVQRVEADIVALFDELAAKGVLGKRAAEDFPP